MMAVDPASHLLNVEAPRIDGRRQPHPSGWSPPLHVAASGGQLDGRSPAVASRHLSQVKIRRSVARYLVTMKRRASFRSASIAVAAVFFAFPAWAGDSSQISYGKRLVEGNCARCHAVGTAGVSTHPDAPPFRLLHLRYPLEDLQEALAEGISTGHPDMPEFVATPDQIDAIIAYIGSLDR